MKYFSLLLLLLTLGFTISCKKKNENSSNHYLTGEDMTWNIYHINDTLKFLSNFNHRRDYRVYKINQGMIEKWDSGISSEYVDIFMSRSDTSIISGINYNIYMQLSRELVASGFFIICTIIDFDNNGIFEITQSGKIDTLKVNNVIYHNVLKIEGDGSLNNLINRVYYVKEKGWLRLESNSGEIWNRIN